MNSRNGFSVLSEQDLYAVNGGGKRETVRDKVGAYTCLLSIADPEPVSKTLLGVVSACCAADYVAQEHFPAGNKPGCVDSKGNAHGGGYSYKYSSGNSSRSDSSSGSSSSSSSSDK